MGGLGPRPSKRLGIRGLIVALRFLTIVPVPGRPLEGPEGLGRAAGWFPVVGLALGGILLVEDRLLSVAFPPVLAAIVVLATWKLLTGAIHLDGVADSLDGLVGRDRDQRLAIMRDSRIGVFATVGLIFLLLLGLVALSGLPWPLRAKALLLAPAIGRLAPLVLARTCEPAAPGRGVGALFMAGVTWRAVGVGGGVVAAASVAVLWPWGLAAAGTGLAASWAVGRYFSARLGGLTGDGLGAGIELAELAVLMAFASLHHLGFV